jgi:aminoglycoside phosphotransferase (APT) family kinase protein
VMPYVFDGSWVSDATPAERAKLQATSVDVLAEIHGVSATADELAAFETGGGSTGGGDGSPLRRHFEAEREYHEWVRGDDRFPVIERAFDWLEAHWPSGAEAAPPVLCWGDARIGNVLYRDFEPVGVLDWEMATIGPRELDVGWFVFLHRFFDDIATQFGMAGLPDFLRRDEVARQYTERTGHEPRDLDWFVVYAATRHGSIMVRTMTRRIQFGEQPPPDDRQDLVMHRATIDALLDGTYRWP